MTEDEAQTIVSEWISLRERRVSKAKRLRQLARKHKCYQTEIRDIIDDYDEWYDNETQTDSDVEPTDSSSPEVVEVSANIVIRRIFLLSLIPSLSIFLGTILIYPSAFSQLKDLAITSASLIYATSILVAFGLGIALNILAALLGGRTDLARALWCASFAMLGVWLSGPILFFWPSEIMNWTGIGFVIGACLAFSAWSRQMQISSSRGFAFVALGVAAWVSIYLMARPVAVFVVKATRDNLI